MFGGRIEFFASTMMDYTVESLQNGLTTSHYLHSWSSLKGALFCLTNHYWNWPHFWKARQKNCQSNFVTMSS